MPNEPRSPSRSGRTRAVWSRRSPYRRSARGGDATRRVSGFGESHVNRVVYDESRAPVNKTRRSPYPVGISSLGEPGFYDFGTTRPTDSAQPPAAARRGSGPPPDVAHRDSEQPPDV